MVDIKHLAYKPVVNEWETLLFLLREKHDEIKSLGGELPACNGFFDISLCPYFLPPVSVYSPYFV